MKEAILLVRSYYGINIHSDAQGDYGTVLKSGEVYPDLPLLNAATILNQSDRFEVKVIDAALDKLLPYELLSTIRNTKCDKLILKTTAAGINSDLKLIRQIKTIKPECETIMAGHVVRNLKNWLTENTDIDILIEEPLDEYIYRYVHGESGDINDMPAPDYTIVDYKKYTNDDNEVRLTLQAGRGCPMSCSYCPYIKFYERVEPRDIDKLIDDIKSVLSLGVDIIQFRDQIFTADRDRIIELCNKIIDENIHFKWICETRLDTLDKELVSLMKKAGLYLVCFGVESADSEILKNYNSNKGDKQTQKEMIDFIKEQGILTMAFYVAGFPEDTWQTLQDTYHYAEYLNSDIVDFNEYIDFDLSKIQNLTPENYCPFENSINNVGEYNLTKDEVRYIISLFSAMYTFNHDSLEKAYTYNHKWSEEYREFLNNLEK